MIDCENEVYNMLATALRSEFPGIDVSSEPVNAPSAFPAASIYMADNYTDQNSMTSNTVETTSVMMFQVDVYSNKAQGRKAEAKKISYFISDFLFAHNFIRTAMTPTPNLQNSSIYRLTSRYRVTSDGKSFFRR